MALCQAIKDGNLKEIQSLLNQGADINDMSDPDYGRTPLTFACTYGQVEAVKLLLASGADPNRKDRQKVTPCWAACDGYEKEAVGELTRLILEAGGKVPAHPQKKDGPLHYAAMAGSLQAVQLLVENGVSMDIPGSYGRTALCYAAADGKSIELVKYLLSAGAEVNCLTDGKDNALFDMLTRDEPDRKIAACLLDGGLNLQYVHPQYGNALAWAAFCGKKNIVELLLERGADVNFDGGKHGPPITHAMSQRHHDIVRLLFQAGADAASKNYGGWSLLEYATEQGDEQLTREILGRLKSAKSGSLETKSVADKKHPTKDSLESIKTNNEKSSKSDTTGQVEALISAARNGNIEMLQILLDDGVDINGKTNWGKETALMKAAYYGKSEALSWLLQRGANVSEKDSRGNTALLQAAWAGRLECLRLLLENGAEINNVNNTNWNALMQAVFESHFEVAELLLQKGSAVNLVDNEKGATALSLARLRSSRKMVELLIAHGAKERETRTRKDGEEYHDLLDCDFCRYLPNRKELGNAGGIDSIDGLDTVHSDASPPDRYADFTVLIKKCRLCGTYYQQDYSYDDEDSFVAGPSVSQHIQRFNFVRLRIALEESSLVSEIKAIEERQPALLAKMKAVLSIQGSKIPSHFLPHYIENVTDFYLISNDWPGLYSNLLKHPDKNIALTVADDLITIAGEYAVEGGFQPFHYYRYGTKALKEVTGKYLKEHAQEFKSVLQQLQQNSGTKKRATEILKSAKYYKVLKNAGKKK